MCNFDATRASLKSPDLFKRFTVSGDGESLAGMRLAATRELIILERNGQRRALLRDQMLYHHAAQGTLAGEPFLVSY